MGNVLDALNGANFHKQTWLRISVPPKYMGLITKGPSFFKGTIYFSKGTNQLRETNGESCQHQGGQSCRCDLSEDAERTEVLYSGGVTAGGVPGLS